MHQLIGCCGLDCEKCDARIATITHGNALREKTAALWTKLNGVPITPEMINCTGCRVEGAKTPFCDSLCPIRNCAREKGVSTCRGLHADGVVPDTASHCRKQSVSVGKPEAAAPVGTDRGGNGGNRSGHDAAWNLIVGG